MDLNQEVIIQVGSTNPVEQVVVDLTGPAVAEDLINRVVLIRVALGEDLFPAKKQSTGLTILSKYHRSGLLVKMFSQLPPLKGSNLFDCFPQKGLRFLLKCSIINIQ